MNPPVALTIAGSDPSGSSGLQADLPTFAMLGAHGTSVVTVVTAQNSVGVQAFHQLPIDLVGAQLESLLDDLPPQATKTGLLRESATVELVEAAAPRLGSLVVDPVLVNSAGRLIVDDETVDVYRRLCSLAVVVTPNRWELEILLGLTEPLDTVEAIESQADAVATLGASTVVVTGGRGDGASATDVVITSQGHRRLSSPRVGAGPIRGTGCTFSAAVTAALAGGRPVADAVDEAHAFVQRQLAASIHSPGAGLAGIPHVNGAG